jgi:hypothetical protein
LRGFSAHANFAHMSQYTRGLSRSYIHAVCNGATKISGDDYVRLECPFRPVTHTICAVCRKPVALNEVRWTDSGQRVSEYRAEVASGVNFWEKLRLALFATAYEGALRLNLDAKGNPKPGARPVQSPSGIVTTLPLPDDQAQVVDSMQRLTFALAGAVPPHVRHVRSEIRMEKNGDTQRLVCHISDLDQPGQKRIEPSASALEAASRLVQVMNPSKGPFPGLTITMERLPDGKWHNNVKLSGS